MFAHPKCPCTRASIEELNSLLAGYGGPVAARVYFFKPTAESEEWTHTDLWQSAARIPGVTVYEDVNGALAQQFGAETSGFVVLYDPQGNLLFKGGITGSRGHMGDNQGESTILSLLSGKNPGTRQTPVYGCSLSSSSCSSNSTIQ